MTSVRVRLSAIGILLALLGSTSAPLLAHAPEPACATHHHDCAKTTQLKDCCCVGHGDASDQGTPAAARTVVAQPIADGTMVVCGAPRLLDGALGHARVLNTAPPSYHPDLITLLGTFLI